MNSVDIIIPMFNSKKFVAETINSVNYPNCNGLILNFFIVDDGSTDGSNEFVKHKFPNIKIFRTSNNGVSAARNLGFHKSSSEFVVFLDSDDLLVGSKIQRQLIIAKKTGADVVYGNWQKLIQDHNGNWIKGPKIERELGKDPDIDFFTHFWCPTGAYLFKRSIVEKVGGFRLDLPVIQDARFALDCALAGAKFVHDPEISCLYRVHKTGSVSTMDRLKFDLDCLLNSEQVAEIYNKRSLFEGDRKKAVGGSGNRLAQEIGSKNIAAFKRAVKLFQIACPEANSALSTKMRILSNIFGYKIARKIINFLLKR